MRVHVIHIAVQLKPTFLIRSAACTDSPFLLSTSFDGLRVHVVYTAVPVEAHFPNKICSMHIFSISLNN